MRMLFLTTCFPFPPVGGERLRAFHFIKYLALDWKITILSFLESKKQEVLLENHPLERVQVGTVILPRLKSYLHCLGGFFSRQPLETAYYTEKKMQELVQKTLQADRYDLIFCHLLRMAPYVADIKGIKKALDICDALSLRYGTASKYRKGAFKFIEWVESKRLTKYEAAVAKKFDLNLVASSLDKHYLEQNPAMRSRLEILENGCLDEETLREQENKFDTRKIVFLGNLRTFHNVDAVKYFYRRIFPLIKQRLNNARFVIVGAEPPRCILQMRRDPAVSVSGEVLDICPLIEDACVSVAPMRICVGIQNKILQSMAYRVPVVTTTLGLGGIRAKQGEEVLVADSPVEFAKNVVMLMQDDNLRGRIINNAYQLIKEQYLWPDICNRLNKKLMALLEK